MPKSTATKKKPRAVKKIVSDLSGGVRTGSTRVRLFKALAKCTYPDGLSVVQLRAKCGLPPKSNHVLTIVVEEVERGRFLKWTDNRGAGAVPVNVYCLTPLGLRDYKEKRVDFTKYAGRRIGQKVG